MASQKQPETMATPPRKPLFDLMRASHIFASGMRELVELKTLREVAPRGMTRSQLHVLKLLVMDGTHQIGQLAELLGVQPPAASKLVDKLERMGLLMRSPALHDRRATLLSVTDNGRALVTRFERQQHERLEPVLAAFEDQEIEHFTQLLERFSLLLYELEEVGKGVCLRCAAYVEADCPVARENCPYHRMRQRQAHEAESKHD